MLSGYDYGSGSNFKTFAGEHYVSGSYRHLGSKNIQLKGNAIYGYGMSGGKDKGDYSIQWLGSESVANCTAYV